MTRSILSLIALITLAAGVLSKAEPPPNRDRSPGKNTPQKTVSASSAEGWHYLKGEWIHSDGYKFVNGQIIRVGAQTHKRPPKPPSKSLLDSVKSKASPTPAPNSAAAKAAEKERNLQPRPAPQTGTHL